MPDYLVFQFRAGRKERFWTSKSPVDVLKCARTGGELGGGIRDCIETALVIKARPPSVRKVSRHCQISHSLAALERQQPDTLFVGVIERRTLKQLQRAADEERDRREDGIQESIKKSAQPLQRKILLAELPASQRTRIRIKTSGCWVWVTAKDSGPYCDIYRRHKGPIPDGAVVRHRCDNRHCVNPNHLELGTCADNVNDMWQRGRAFQQCR